MCGRILQSGGPFRYATVEGMNVKDGRVSNYPPRWNGAPSQELLVIRRNRQTGQVSLDQLRWGPRHDSNVPARKQAAKSRVIQITEIEQLAGRMEEDNDRKRERMRQERAEFHARQLLRAESEGRLKKGRPEEMFDEEEFKEKYPDYRAALLRMLKQLGRVPPEKE
jgi:putative SOS response-associated peptidase YedK